MKYGKKKIITLIVAFVLVFGVTFSVAPTNKASAAGYSRYFLQVAFKLINWAGNYWYNISPVISYGSNADTISSGSIHFNSSSYNYGASIKHTVNYQESEDEMDLWGETTPLNWPGDISIIITNPYGNDVVSKTVDHKQHVYFHSSTLGNYTVRFVENSKESWNTWIMYHHYENIIDPCAVSKPTTDLQLSSGGPDKIVVCSSANTVAMKDDSGATKTYTVEKIDGGIYVVPSSERLNSKSKHMNWLSFADLENQVYDANLNITVRNFKDLNIGDKLKFKDTIKSLRYDQDKDYTWFSFMSKDGDITEWPFKGDLTKQYKVGDDLKLKFKIVPEIDNSNKYEVLDYLKYGLENDTAPSIDSYLIK